MEKTMEHEMQTVFIHGLIWIEMPCRGSGLEVVYLSLGAQVM